jgi:hypothetical protein
MCAYERFRELIDGEFLRNDFGVGCIDKVAIRAPGLHWITLGCRYRTSACLFCETISISSLQRFQRDRFSALASARISAQANRLCAGCRSRKAGCSIASAPILRPSWQE